MRGTSRDKGQQVASAMSSIVDVTSADGIPAVNGNAQLHEAKSLLPSVGHCSILK
jgi:hypothetical protein